MLNQTFIDFTNSKVEILALNPKKNLKSILDTPAQNTNEKFFLSTTTVRENKNYKISEFDYDIDLID